MNPIAQAFMYHEAAANLKQCAMELEQIMEDSI